MKHRVLAVLALMLTVGVTTGCNTLRSLAPCSDGHCRPPVEIISELQELGVTLSYHSRPLPKTIQVDKAIDAKTGEEFVFSNSLELMFSPTVGHEELPNPDPRSSGFSDHPYVYTFSYEANGSFAQIKPYNVLDPYDFLPLEATRFAPLQVVNQPPELVVFGNYILRAAHMIPVRATHIELWIRQNGEQNFILITRTPLSSLLAYKEFLSAEL